MNNEQILNKFSNLSTPRWQMLVCDLRYRFGCYHLGFGRLQTICVRQEMPCRYDTTVENAEETAHYMEYDWRTNL